MKKFKFAQHHKKLSKKAQVLRITLKAKTIATTEKSPQKAYMIF
jgi:hypothetical protein